MQQKNSGLPNPAVELDKLSQQHKVSLKRACDRAGVAYSTVWRWRQKTPEIFQTYEKLRKAIIEMGAERGNA